MANPATICFVAPQHRAAFNAIFDALGYGPQFRVPVTKENPPATTSAPSSWFFAETSPEDDAVAVYEGLRVGTLPSLPPGVVWGEDGVISQADAQAAVSALTFEVYTAGGGAVVPYDWMHGAEDENGVRHGGILLSRNERLVPAEEN